MAAFNTVHKIKVTNLGGSLQTSAPITLKNQIQEINSLRNIRDVLSVNVVAGATIVYNQTTNMFEIRPISASDLGNFNLDGGVF